MKGPPGGGNNMYIRVLLTLHDKDLRGINVHGLSLLNIITYINVSKQTF